MSRDVSDTLKEAVNAQQTGEAFIMLIEIDHDDLETPIRIASDGPDELENGANGVISNGQEYVFLPFEPILPNQDKDRLPIARIRIDNISREIIQAVRTISGAPSFKIMVVLSSDPDTVEIELTGYKLRNVTADAMSVEGELVTEQFDIEPFPSGRFTPANFPSLFN